MTVAIPPSQRHAERQRRRKAIGRRRASAWAFSLGVHVIAALAFFGTASGSFVGAEGPGSDHGLMNVTMVSAASLRVPAQGDPEAARLRPLLARFDNGLAPEQLDVNAPSKLSSLFDRVERTQPEVPPSSGRTQEVSTAKYEGGRDRTSAQSAGSTGRGTQTASMSSSAGGGLWGLVQPCWRKVAGHSRVPVTLEVTLDSRGRLGRPPRIIRLTGSAVDEPRLRSEAQALAALAECAPDGDLRLAGQVYRLEFIPQP